MKIEFAKQPIILQMASKKNGDTTNSWRSQAVATHAEPWSGHLTIGQHFYFWTSADAGDAHLLDTEECATLEDAIVALTAEIARLCRALSVV